MKILFEIIGIIVLIIIVLIVLFLIGLAIVPTVPNKYISKVETGGIIEEKYLKMGSYAINHTTFKGSELTKLYTIYYPKELEIKDKEYPVIFVLNGTGVLPKKCKALFEHLSSWKFIVVGNDDPSTGNGKSSDETMDFIFSLNESKGSIFYHQIDLENIGIIGHSQGGAGVFSALSFSKYKDYYKTGVSLSPTHEEVAHAFGWNYDLSKINVPIIMFAGTKGDFETKLVIPLDKMIKMYDKIPSSKIMARRIGVEHGQMLYSVDGYITAWFMWQLQEDKKVSNAFLGEKSEFLNNKLYTDININLKIESKK